MFTRRTFLKSGGFALGSFYAGPLFNGREMRTGKRKVLVTVFQRGGMDGLMAVSPLNDSWLKKMRPRLAMFAGRRQGANALIDLDGKFGLHPAFAPLAQYYKEGKLAVVHGVGSSYITRSHPDAQAHMEKSLKSLNEQLLRNTGRESFEAIGHLSKKDLCADQPADGVEYPRSPLGNALKQIAQLIKAEVGLEIAFAETRGWDTHVQQGTGNGTFAQRARDLSSSVAAFWKDVELHHDRVVLMTMTEFGRTVHENGSGGTDHGRASCLFVLGNDVDGGKVHGKIPELDPDALLDGRDLPVTTDFRSVFSGVVSKHLGVSTNQSLFPGWTGNPVELMKS